MKAAIIGASAEALHTIEKAHVHGVRVAAFDGNPTAPGLAAADDGLVVDISREEELLQAARRENPDFVLTVPIGRYLTSVGAVNDALSLPGITREMALACTDKFLFHQKLAACGLRNCRCRCLGRGAEGREDRPPLEYPAILKPRFGSGGRGIFLVENRERLSAALQAIGEEPYVLEDCVAGTEYGVDAAVIRGELFPVLLRRKVNTPPPARQAVGYFSCDRRDPFWQPVWDSLAKVTRCLGLEECLLHGDVIQGKEGPFWVELSARPSGHHLHDLFTPLCTGVDMAEEYLKYRLGEPFSFVPGETRPMMIHYFDGIGKVRHVPGREEIEALLLEGAGRPAPAALRFWQCNLRPGERMDPVRDGHSLMGRGCYILEGTDAAGLLALSEKIMGRFYQ